MADDAKIAELVGEFSNVTGVDSDRAKFYLESSGWQLQVALGSFYDNDGGEDEAMFHDAPEELQAPPTGGRPPVGHRSAAVPNDEEDEDLEADMAVPSGAGGRPKPAPTSRLRTLNDYAKGGGEDNESDEEGQTFYAGGSDHGSGQQVVGPRRKKANNDSIVNSLFKSAREHGAQEVGAGSSSMTDGPGSNFVFKGAGYRLGESETGPVRPEPGTVGTLPPKKAGERHVILKMWKNGFSLDDGELRDFKDPQNADFLDSISKGEIPQELLRSAQGGQINLDLEDRRGEEFNRPKVKVKPFSGQGNILGSPVPAFVGGATPAVADVRGNEESAQESLTIDQTQPVTNIQVRLADGTRLVNKFNHSHTVGDIRRYIINARPVYTVQPFALLTTFPNKDLTDDSQTLAEAKLLNAVIVQRLK